MSAALDAVGLDDEEAPTWQELAALRQKHQKDWTAGETLMVAHIEQRMRLSASMPAGAAVGRNWVPSRRDMAVQRPECLNHGEWYQYGYTNGWNACLECIEEQRTAIAKATGEGA